MPHDITLGLHKFECTLKPKHGFLVLSPLRIVKKKGRIECWGSEIEYIEVEERGIPVLIRALETSNLEVWAPSRLVEIPEIIPKEWEELASKIKSGDTVMLLGGIDVGKSGLFAFLANKLVSSGLKLGLIDADIGQSDIGPVGTIGLSLIEETIIHPSLTDPDFLFFVGDNTPRGHLLPMVIGTRKLLDTAKRKGADVILINTTGYIHSSPARALKRFKILATEPTKVVILQRKDESEHIVKLIPRSSEIIKIPVSRSIRRKNRSYRVLFRQNNIKRYLNGARSMKINVESTKLVDTLFFSGSSSPELNQELEKLLGTRVIYAEESPDLILCVLNSSRLQKGLMVKGKPLRVAMLKGYEGLYVGFLDSLGFCHGIGIIESFRPNQGILEVYSSFSGNFEYIDFGFLKFNRDGVQIGRRGLTEP
ncbi:MAG: hypothetical protein DRN90_02865 [Thermoproteota archaeon]|nr:MAG: hypothetical protein DRN90_02865 [Candidatus Korarchaeota archaeon]